MKFLLLFVIILSIIFLAYHHMLSYRDILEEREEGLYCPAGGFYIDPSRPVDLAVVTHAHADHAIEGSTRYYCSSRSLPLMKVRVGDCDIRSIPYGTAFQKEGVSITFYPSGHIPGAAQVLIEKDGYRVVVTGDFKRKPDKVTEDFQVVQCDLLVMETTFALPVFSWETEEVLEKKLRSWVRTSAHNGQSSVIIAYSLGKAQRVLSMLENIELPLIAHGAVRRFQYPFSTLGIDLPELHPGNQDVAKKFKGKGIIIAPPSALNSPWLRKFKPYKSCFASGWMAVRGNKKRKGVDYGLVLSDHADWQDLLDTVSDCKAKTVWTTHGYSTVFARYLTEQLGIEAYALEE